MGSLKSQVTFLRDLLVCMLHDMVDGISYTEKQWTLDSTYVERRVDAEGLSFLTKTLPAYGKAIDFALANHGALVVPAHKKRGDTSIPRFLGKLTSQVFNDRGITRIDACPLAVKRLRRICYLFYKYKTDPGAAATRRVADSFIATDAELGVKDYPKGVLIDAARFLKRVVSTLDVFNIIPQHGPGAVSTREKVHQKMSFKRFIPRLNAMYPYDSYFFYSAAHLADEFAMLSSMDEYEPISKVVFVPKDSRGPRLISCEPLELQWIQQGLRKVLYDHIESHPLTQGHVNFTDQSINQRLALEASVTGSYATLDMKEASDRVSLKLVETLFEGTTLLDALLATRSSGTVLPDGRRVEYKKFAPMGSALCFPVEALVFYAISVAAIRAKTCCSYKEATRNLYVYGDDIICDIRHHAWITEALESCDLLVNKLKSCVSGFFRESCGMDAFKGVPVTPIRVSARLVSSRRTSNLLSYVEYCNSMYAEGYERAAGHIERYVRTFIDLPTFGCKQPFLSFVKGDVLPTRASTQCKTRYNRGLQRLEVLGWWFEPIKVRSRHSSWSEMLRRLPEQRQSDDPLKGSPPSAQFVHSVPRRVKLKRGWMPVNLG